MYASCAGSLCRGVLVVAASAALLPGFAATAQAASPHDQAYLACANGYEGNSGDCVRICRSFLKQKNNPLGDMRQTCMKRVMEKPSGGVPEPD